MSSSGGNKKSMDDVLSSIRRIIGNEGEGGGATGQAGSGTAGGARSEPRQLGDPVAPGQTGAGGATASGQGGSSGGTGGGSEAGGGEPLSLTPNMRADAPEQSGGSGPLSLAGMEASSAQTPASPPPSAPPASPAPASSSTVEEDEDTVVIDEAALEDMIRRIVREELDKAIEADTESDEHMRRIVREELMGETGKNISRNVQTLIRSEVERLLKHRGV